MSQQNPIRQSLDARLSGLQPSAARRARIREAIGAEEVDMGGLIDLANQFINGEITEDEFKDKSEKWAGED